jgi:periplasmic divalent cation tolerance protein
MGTMILVLTTYPDRKTAGDAAKRLVKTDLAACVSIIRVESSVYKWKGIVKEEGEFMLMIKAKSENHIRLELAIRAGHPYQLPEIIRINADAALSDYLDWVRGK